MSPQRRDAEGRTAGRPSVGEPRRAADPRGDGGRGVRRPALPGRAAAARGRLPRPATGRWPIGCCATPAWRRRGSNRTRRSARRLAELEAARRARGGEPRLTAADRWVREIGRLVVAAMPPSSASTPRRRRTGSIGGRWIRCGLAVEAVAGSDRTAGRVTPPGSVHAAIVPADRASLRRRSRDRSRGSSCSRWSGRYGRWPPTRRWRDAEGGAWCWHDPHRTWSRSGSSWCVVRSFWRACRRDEPRQRSVAASALDSPRWGPERSGGPGGDPGASALRRRSTGAVAADR